VRHGFAFGEGLRLESGGWDLPAVDDLRGDTADHGVLEPHFLQKAPEGLLGAVALSPSDLGGAKALVGEGGLTEDEAKRRGTQIHKLLEVFPVSDPAQWDDLASVVLGHDDLWAAPEAKAALIAEARGVLAADALSWLFHGDALLEVEVSAALPELGGRRINGAIDRLIVTPERIVAVDFKTNAVVPHDPHTCPEGILRQMGAYSAALALIYPGRQIETAVVWTRAAQLMLLPNDLVRDALHRSMVP